MYYSYIYYGKEQEPEVDERERERCNMSSIVIIIGNIIFIDLVSRDSSVGRAVDCREHEW